jgi:hypothetical protein
MAEGLVKHFPIRRGLLSRVSGQVQAVDGVDLQLSAPATRWAWSANRAAASRRWAGCCCA